MSLDLLPMKRSKFLPGSIVVALFLVILSGCKQEKAPQLSAASPPQVLVAAVEQRDVPIVREWIGQLDGSENVDVRARVSGYIQEIAFNPAEKIRRRSRHDLRHGHFVRVSAACSAI